MAGPGAESQPRAGARRRTAIRRAGAREALIEFLVVLAVLAAVVLVVGWPLRSGRMDSPEPPASDELAELEAARDAKYREIRDAELDHQTGKLSDQDFAALDAALRQHAVELLHAIDRYHHAQP